MRKIKKYSDFIYESDQSWMDSVRRGTHLICKTKGKDLIVGNEYVVSDIMYDVWNPYVTLEGFKERTLDYDEEYPLEWFDISK